MEDLMQTKNSNSENTLVQVTLSLAHGKALGLLPLSPWPERILQFGEGNFLRGFVDWMVEVLNRETDFRGGIVAIKPTRSSHTETLEQLRRQDHLYTVVLRGLRQGQVYEESRLITSIVSSLHIEKDWEALLQKATNPSLRFVVSNTTEAGIAYQPEAWVLHQPPKSFPAILTAWLYQRYLHFKGASNRGMLILPCELIENNGAELKRIILLHARDWKLGSEFETWLCQHNHFANTLVDRIVPGFPKGEMEEWSQRLGYRDELLVSGEPYHLWGIEGDPIFQKEWPSLPTINVVFTQNLLELRTRKVKVLNGLHTMTVLLGHLAGLSTVRQCLEHPQIGAFMHQGVNQEIAPTLSGSELEAAEYIRQILERFANPHIQHQCLSIALNSISKFKVRVLPTMLEYMGLKGQPPKYLGLSLAALILFYRVQSLEHSKGLGHWNGEAYPIQDTMDNLLFMQRIWQEDSGDLQKLTARVLAEQSFWGQDCSSHSNLVACVAENLHNLMALGPISTLKNLLDG